MNLRAYLFLILTFLSLPVIAQDKIYKKNGDIIACKVKTVDDATILYKRADNPDGPEYTILKKEASKIVYDNGTVDNFEGMPSNGTRSSKQYEKQDKNNRRFGNNILTIIPAAYTAEVVYSSINDPGIGICYEKLLDDNGHISICLPVMINFVQNKDFNSDIYNNGNNYTNSAYTGSGNYTSYLVMPGIKFYPARKSQRVRYSLGLSFYALFGKEPYATYSYNSTSSYGYTSLVSSDDFYYHMVGLAFSNSLNITVSRNLYMELDANAMAPVIDNRQRDAATSEDLYLPIMQWALKVGYRF